MANKGGFISTTSAVIPSKIDRVFCILDSIKEKVTCSLNTLANGDASEFKFLFCTFNGRFKHLAPHLLYEIKEFKMLKVQKIGSAESIFF